MASLKILICGGGVAGPCVAFWLSRLGHQVTIVERFPVLRASGAQIDFRGQGIDLLKRMNLLEPVRSKLVHEPGVKFVDSDGKVQATIAVNDSGQGAQGPTSEYEIMRGDLVRLLYDATKDSVQYIFGKTVERFEQDDKTVKVHFSDGQSGVYDALIGADGQGSRIRQAIMSPGALDPIHRIGLYLAYWIVPRVPGDDDYQKMYHAPSRLVASRSHNATETQCYLALRDDSEEVRSIPRAPVETQKDFLAQRFKGAGWQTGRFIEGMRTTENLYVQDVVQVRTDTWYRGRVVLLADAAHCSSPLSGMGTTGAFVGAYVLAGEIARSPHDLSQAFANYDKVMRPFVAELQKINPWFLYLSIPKTQWGISILRTFVWMMSYVLNIILRFRSKDKGGWPLPDYPELSLK